MTLQERQKREIEALRREIHIATEKRHNMARQMGRLKGEIDDKKYSLKQVKSDPETYFKNIDEEE